MRIELEKALKDWNSQTQTAPTMAVVGGSTVGKTRTIAGLASLEYREGLTVLAGDGNTSSYPTTIELSATISRAEIILSRLKSREELIDNVRRHLKLALFSELKNSLSSRPKDEAAQRKFFLEAMYKRLVPNDQTFRIHKLLGEEVNGEYHEYMAEILREADKMADLSFRKNYAEQLERDKAKANQMLEELIVHFLEDSSGDMERCTTNPFVQELVNKIIAAARNCLETAGFYCDMDDFGNIQSASVLEIDDKDNDLLRLPPASVAAREKESFTRRLRAITNDRRGEYQSAACVIGEAYIRVRGDYPLSCMENGPHAYRILDVIGFDNDSFNITGRVSEALLSSVPYDVVLYTTKLKSTPVQNREYLSAIQKTIRPCQIIVALTHFDTHDIFSIDDEDGPTRQQIEEAVTSTKREILEQIRSELGTDCRAKLPAGLSDIICFANFKGLKRLGTGAVEVFGGEAKTYVELRDAFRRAYNAVRYKIKGQNIAEVSTPKGFIGAGRSMEALVHPLRRKLEVSVTDEFAGIRDRAGAVHHWTLDALIWNLSCGIEHISNAMVWENVRITTYTQFASICFEQIASPQPKFAQGVNIPQSADRDRIIREFESNLRSQLRKAAAKFFLKNAEGQESDCKVEMRRLAARPKYDKWGVMHDLLECLQEQLRDEAWLEECIQYAIREAAESTYKRLIL